MAFAPVDAVPYALAVLAALVGYVYPEYFALLLIQVGLAAYAFFAPKPGGERELLLASFIAGAAAHWAAGRAFAGSGFAAFSFPPYALWGVALALSLVWAREAGERPGHAFALGAVVLPLAMGPAAYASRLDALVVSAVLLALGAVLAVRLGPSEGAGGRRVARNALVAALASSIASGLAFLVQTAAVYTLPPLGDLAWVYVNLAWYALVPSAVAIAGFALLHHMLLTRGREARRLSIAPAVFEEG